MPGNVRRMSAYILVPAILVVADVAANRTALKFLLLPPLGALTYLLFVNPGNVPMNIRRVVICPAATAAFAWALANTLGYNAPSVALATIGTMIIMYVLRADLLVPPLALALLTVLLHNEVHGRPDYILSVFVFTTVLYAIHRAWLRLPSGPQEGD